MVVFKYERVADKVQSGRKEHNWRKELPLPARLALFSAWATLMGCLAVTLFAWRGAREDIQQDAHRRFDLQVEQILFAIEARMQTQEQVLRGARALFDASDEVTRREWRSYINSLQLEKNYPGILGIGLARRVTRDRLKQHEAEVRADGYPDYVVRPPGDRPEYMPIVYLEPFDWRNRRAFGFDMLSEPARREAMETARDSGNPAVTRKVTLVQETEKDVQAGFLMYLPVYRHGNSGPSVAERRLALLGYVYSPFRMRDLMTGILGPSLPDLRLRIYDGGSTTEDALMYDSHPAQPSGTAPPDTQSDVRLLGVAGHLWTIQVTALKPYDSDAAYQKPRLILQAGISISILLFIVVWSLVTLRRRATVLAEDMTAALRESQAQFQAVAETANDPIISANAAGRIIYFNRAAEVVFGYRQHEVIDQPLTLLIPESLQQAHQEGMAHFLATGKARIMGKTIQLTARRKDHSEFPMEISIADWGTPEGVFFTAILRDITERVQAEGKIRQLNDELLHQVDQLNAANQELESFSYSVSHDLRAPLRAIAGFSRLLEEEHGASLLPEGSRLLRVIRENSIKMGQLIDDLLAFARLGQASVAHSRVDMGVLVQDVLEEICQAGDGKRVEFAIAYLPPAQGDKALLRQVWMNLIANAVKFSLPRAEPRVEAGCLSVDGENQYFVRDNGVGFDMTYASELFGVFKRLHKAEQFPGTGVGLAIVHRVVTKHGGRVWAESQVNQGATFYFTLPVESEES